MRRKVVFGRWILVVFVVNGLVVILLSVQNVTGGFIAVNVVNGFVIILLSVQNVRVEFIALVLVRLGRSVYYRVGMLLSVEYVWVIIVQ